MVVVVFYSKVSLKYYLVELVDDGGQEGEGKPVGFGQLKESLVQSLHQRWSLLHSVFKR